MRRSHDFVVRSRAFVKCPLPRRKKETCKQACSLFFYRLDWRFIHCFRVYYSMIEATRPDPTVRPPSRYQTGVLRCANSNFSCDSWGKIRIFCFVRVVFGDFVIMVLSHIIQFSNSANNNSSLYRLYHYL